MGTFVFVCVLVCLVAVLVAASPALVRQVKTRRSAQLLSRISRRFRGTMVSNRKLGNYVLVRILGRPYRIQLHEQELPFITISAPWMVSQAATVMGGEAEPSSFRMSITPSRKWRGITDAQDIELGNPLFDQRFFVQTNDEKVLLGTVTRHCQELIEKIYRQFFDRKFEIRVVGNELQLDNCIRANQPAKVFVIVRFFAELHGLLLAANEVASSIDVDSVELSGDTMCLICGEVVVEQVVQCRSCTTEYHRDCWEYVGSCGRYACGEESYLSEEGDSDPELFRINE